MASAALPVEELLAKVSDDQPAGEDISIAPDWVAINEARRKDPLHGRENCDWPLIYQLVSAALHKSKDLRLAVWLTEAAMKLHGFTGLRDGAKLIRGLVETYWDTGLYPEVEAGDLQFRAMPLEWFSGDDNLPFSIYQVPLTARNDGGPNYSYSAYRQSKAIGFEKDTRNSMGDVDEAKDQLRRSRLAAGGISGEMFEEAAKATRRAPMEAIYVQWEEAAKEFEDLDRVLGERFGADAPPTSDAKEAIEDCRRVLNDLLKRKRQEEPDPVAKKEGEDGPPGEAQKRTAVLGFGGFDSLQDGEGGSWAKAEELVRQGDVAGGLAEMARLAAQQYGRANFQRRLRLAEICLQTGRARLGIAILEELAKVVDEHHLENWESSSLVGRVWGRLYHSYKAAEPDSEQAARGKNLFDRLCRLDPWQALGWDE